MKNHGNYIVSLGNVCKWLSEVAENLGVEIYPGFSAAEVLVDENNKVYGVATGDMGVSRDGSAKTLGNQEWSFMQNILFSQKEPEALYLNT